MTLNDELIFSCGATLYLTLQRYIFLNYSGTVGGGEIKPVHLGKNGEDKLGLSCAKLSASLNFSGLDLILVYFDRLT